MPVDPMTCIAALKNIIEEREKEIASLKSGGGGVGAQNQPQGDNQNQINDQGGNKISDDKLTVIQQ